MYRITYPETLLFQAKKYGHAETREICSLEPADPSETYGRPGFWKVRFKTGFLYTVLYLDEKSTIAIVGEKRYGIIGGRVTEYDDGVEYGYGSFARLGKILAQESVMEALEAL